MTDYEKHFSTFFNEAADIAGAVTLKYFRKEIPVDDKQDNSPVTQVDREVEQKLREVIGKNFPDHGIVGEEFGREKDDAEFVWVIDPIDGTKSFITGRPLFGTIIGLLHQGVPKAGLIDQAFTKERWFGIADQFATYNKIPIRVGAPRALDAARLYTGSLAMFDGKNFDPFLDLCRVAKLTQYSCDCYAYGLLAMGWADVVVEQRLKIYDVAGAVPIITGAGGFIGNWDLQPITMDYNGTLVAASSKQLAVQALNILKKNL